ncbi:ThuA domain-containing protein [bacterium]|nr:ThuA domain-containing protein [bacterium]
MPTPGQDGAGAPVTIVLLAGRVKVPDRIGHHDYLAGCRLLAGLLEQTNGVRAVVVAEGWPADESLLQAARCVVVYAGGAHKSPLLATPERSATIERLAQAGVGLVMIHQAVSYPADRAAQAAAWIGGAHVAGHGARGHWPASHREFPAHPVTRGVAAWDSHDGWLREIRFVDGLRGVTPLVWSSRQRRDGREGGTDDVVAWAYERPHGGRAFCYTGLDGHAAWSAAGVRQLLVNGTLWAAGLPIPNGGAPCAIAASALSAYLTPRGSRRAWIGKLMRRGLRRLTAGRADRRAP